MCYSIFTMWNRYKQNRFGCMVHWRAVKSAENGGITGILPAGIGFGTQSTGGEDIDRRKKAAHFRIDGRL